jgi:hypothetical protein
MITGDGLVPQGPYSAWLVSASGMTCPIGQAYDGPASSAPTLLAAQLQVDAMGRGALEASLTATSDCGGGRTFGQLSNWSRVEIVFHADNTFHGSTQGPQHWAQVSVPVPSLP